MSREYLLCWKCFRSKMQARRVIEHGRTLQLECPNCGALDYIPVWGKRSTKPSPQPSGDDIRYLRRRQLSVTLKSVTHKLKKGR